MESPASEEPISQPQARTLLSAFTTFLTLTVHTILHHRGIYPPETFLLTKHHNLPVYQSRHPGVCSWINDAVAQVRVLLAHGRLTRVCINIHQSKSLQVIERWVFDVSSFPTWVDDEAERIRQEKGKGKEVVRPMTWAERDRRERRPQRGTEEERDELERLGGVNWADVDESIRGALRRIGFAAEAKVPLEECTFTIAVELKDNVDVSTSVGPSQDWIPSEPDQQPIIINPTSPGSANVTKTTTPLRTVQAGPLFFECWVEETAAAQGIPLSLDEALFSQDSEYP